MLQSKRNQRAKITTLVHHTRGQNDNLRCSAIGDFIADNVNATIASNRNNRLQIAQIKALTEERDREVEEMNIILRVQVTPTTTDMFC